METLKELVLDQFGNAISNVLKSVRSQGILLKAETTQEQKKKKSKNQALSEVTDRSKQFLNEDQKLKYKALNDESNKSRKKTMIFLTLKNIF
jgi:prophage antirepressor-like protein